MVDKKEAMNIAKLARLKFTETELEKIAGDMQDILKWIDVLQTADTSKINEIKEDIPPLRMREDKVTIAGLSDELMKNATEPYEHFFTVPKVVE